jgi:hypothetical protein
MTLVESGRGERSRGSHVGELRLRRYRIGELAGAEREEVARHTAGCDDCNARLGALDDEQRAFERDIPLPRFAGGVERAVRVPRSRPRSIWAIASVGLAAAAALVLVARPGTIDVGTTPDSPSNVTPGPNNLKGSWAGVRIGGADGRDQWSAQADKLERLAPGDRLRLGYRVDAPRFFVAVAIDQDGVVTPLYPEAGSSLAAAPSRQPTYLAGSVELTGQGLERVYLLFAERPFAVSSVTSALRAAFEKAGALTALSPTSLDGVAAEISSFTFAKP